MKLILDFDKAYSVKITSEDDSHWYRLAWLPDEKDFALWYDDTQFVKHFDYLNKETAIANVVANLLSQVKEDLWK